MMLVMSRREMIEDMPSFCEDVFTIMNDNELIKAWKRHGIHAGTRYYDSVEIRET